MSSVRRSTTYLGLNLKDALSNFEILKKELAKMSDSADKLENQYEERSALEAQKYQLDKDNKANEELAAELSQSKARVESLLKKLSDIKDQSGQDKMALQDNVDALKKKLSKASKNATKVETELSQSKAENESLSQKMRKQEVEYGQDKKALKEKVDELEKKLHEKESKVTKAMINPKVFFDLTQNGTYIGRIVIELYADTTPILAENFRALCTGEKGVGRNCKPLHYKGMVFDIFDDVWRVGQFGSESIYGDTSIPSENFIRKHNGIGEVGMYRIADNKNAGQVFYIAKMKMDRWDDIDVVCGRVVDGMNVLLQMQPIVLIADCGQLS